MRHTCEHNVYSERDYTANKNHTKNGYFADLIRTGKPAFVADNVLTSAGFCFRQINENMSNIDARGVYSDVDCVDNSKWLILSLRDLPV